MASNPMETLFWYAKDKLGACIFTFDAPRFDGELFQPVEDDSECIWVSEDLMPDMKPGDKPVRVRIAKLEVVEE